MTLEFRPCGEPQGFDLFEGDDKVGELIYCPPDEELDRATWTISVWSAMGTGKTWYSDTAESHEEAATHAREMCEERNAERRELSKGAHGWTTSSIPMGGKPGWRRR
ncbi:hypothetical protein OG352_06615 [Streptomyces sp. NBC_01485]|uniref:hypothetical protein n=1 Tax=Streptomyces sp. NBC_01485 TaxID=2903884 RepID=UPI002E32ABB4|nr:hypothetical protein [Streptomyces sp. NBC_01485]